MGLSPGITPFPPNSGPYSRHLFLFSTLRICSTPFFFLCRFSSSPLGEPPVILFSTPLKLLISSFVVKTPLPNKQLFVFFMAYKIQRTSLECGCCFFSFIVTEPPSPPAPPFHLSSLSCRQSLPKYPRPSPQSGGTPFPKTTNHVFWAFFSPQNTLLLPPYLSVLPPMRQFFFFVSTCGKFTFLSHQSYGSDLLSFQSLGCLWEDLRPRRCTMVPFPFN